MSTKNPADTTAVQNQIADNKAQVQKNAEQTPAPATTTTTPAIAPAATLAVQAEQEQKANEQAAKQPENADKADEVADRLKEEKKATKEEDKAADKLPDMINGLNLKSDNPLEKEMAQAALNEQLGALDREEQQLKAHEEFFVDPEEARKAMILTMGNADGKMTEPNFITEEDHHNALSAISTARLNEPDFVDAVHRGKQAVKTLINQQEERPTLVGAGVDHELTDPERNQVDILRSRGETRDVKDPKNLAPEDGATAKTEEKEMSTQRAEIAKAEKAHEKELKDLESGRADEVKQREQETEAQVQNQKKLLEAERRRQQGLQPDV